MINQDNDVFAFGNNEYGQLGLSHIEYDSFYYPKKLILFEEKVPTAIAAGSNHSVVLVIEGYAYSWGCNSQGQLAHGE